MKKTAPRSFRDTFDLKDYGFPEVPMFGYYRNDKAIAPLGLHTHNAYEICFLVEGRQNYSTGGRDYLMKAGDIYMTKPGEYHDSGKQPQEKGSIFWINIRPVKTGEKFLGLSPEYGKALFYSLAAVKEKLFPGSLKIRAALFNAHSELLRPPSVLTMVGISNAITTILLEVIRCAGRSGKTAEDTGNMNRAIVYINEHLEEPLRVPELAVHMKLSESWFKARFRKETGLPPAEYIIRLRIKRAKEFLENGKGNVTDAAMKFGFASSQHFATAFRKYMNVSPSTIKRPG